MTVTDIAWLLRSNSYSQKSNQPILPNGSLSPANHVNPYCNPGMDITGLSKEDFQMVPVSKEAEEKMKCLAMKGIETYYGMSGPDGDRVANAIEAYSKQAAVSDRINISYTLTNIYRTEVNHIFDFIRSRIPDWEIGHPFDTTILKEYQQGIDTRA